MFFAEKWSVFNSKNMRSLKKAFAGIGVFLSLKQTFSKKKVFAGIGVSFHPKTNVL